LGNLFKGSGSGMILTDWASLGRKKKESQGDINLVTKKNKFCPSPRKWKGTMYASALLMLGGANKEGERSGEGVKEVDASQKTCNPREEFKSVTIHGEK